MQVLVALESITQKQHTEKGALFPLLYVALSQEHSFYSPLEKPGFFSDPGKKGKKKNKSKPGRRFMYGCTYMVAF